MVSVNVGKREVIFLAVFSIIFAAGFAVATWDSPSVYHDSESVKVTIGGEDYSLQEAIDDGLIGGGSGGGEGLLTKVPCEINITGMDSSGDSEKCGVNITYDGKSYAFRTPDHSEISWQLCWSDLERQLREMSRTATFGVDYVYLGREQGYTTAVGQTKKCVMGKISV